MADLKDILNQDDALNNNELMKYLEGIASDKERFAIEKQMVDSEFVNDGVEGLQDFEDTARMQQYAEELNRQLRKQTTTRKKRKKRNLKDQNWTLIAIVMILVLCVLAYFVIHLYRKTHSG